MSTSNNKVKPAYNVSKGSWAHIVRHGGAVPAPTQPPPLRMERGGVLSLVLPPGARVTPGDMAKALQEQCKKPALWQPFIYEGHLLLQSLGSQEDVAEDKALFMTDGLSIKGFTAKARPVFNVANNGDMVSGTVVDIAATEFALSFLRTEFEKLGHLVAFRVNTFPGTEVPDGTVEFVLDISEHGIAPRSKYIIDQHGWLNTCHVQLHGRQRFCYYCRKGTHLRKDCTEAPPCSTCSSKGHHPLACKTSKISPSQTSRSSDKQVLARQIIPDLPTEAMTPAQLPASRATESSDACESNMAVANIHTSQSGTAMLETQSAWSGDMEGEKEEAAMSARALREFAQLGPVRTDRQVTAARMAGEPVNKKVRREGSISLAGSRQSPRSTKIQ